MIKELLPKQVVCNEKNSKRKSCHGALKRYYPFSSYYNEVNHKVAEEIKDEFGKNEKLVLLKCQECNTIFSLPQILKEKFRQES